MPKSANHNPFRVSLNLLHPNEIPPSLPTRFLRWVISYGRYIVIFTEIIVVAAFVFRFKLDSDLDNLKTNINKNLPYVEGLVADEALIRQTQLKLQTIGQVYDNIPDWNQILNNTSSEMPQSVHLNSLNLDTNSTDNEYISVKLAGETTSTSDLGVFIRKLRNKTNDQKIKLFKDITLDTLAFEKDKLTFTISGGVKKQ